MAGSLAHIVSENGTFRMDLIENLGDAHEALDECFKIIFEISGGKREEVNSFLRELHFPQIDVDMKLGGEDSL